MQDILRYAGMALCAGGIMFFTFSLTARMRRRVRSIDAFIGALNIMRAEIQTHMSDLYDIFGMLAVICPAPAGAFFERVSVANGRPGELMRGALQDMREELCLGDEEYDALFGLASAIGLYDIESQLRDITRAITRLDSARYQAETDRAGRSRLYGTIGVSGALLFVLILL